MNEHYQRTWLFPKDLKKNYLSYNRHPKYHYNKLNREGFTQYTLHDTLRGFSQQKGVPASSLSSQPSSTKFGTILTLVTFLLNIDYRPYLAS